MLDGHGWIYLIKESGDDLLHKIGVTKSDDINKRLKKLQTGNGNKLLLVKSFLSNKPYKLEKMLHWKYQENREEGEWFLMTKDDVNGFINECERCQKIIDALKDNPFF